jgi:hypothetical protein
MTYGLCIQVFTASFPPVPHHLQNLTSLVVGVTLLGLAEVQVGQASEQLVSKGDDR